MRVTILRAVSSSSTRSNEKGVGSIGIHSGHPVRILPCVITRASNSGFGCVARSFGPESLFSLDNFIRSHKDDSSGIMEAFLGYLNLSEATTNL